MQWTGCGTDIKAGESDSFVSCHSRLTVDTVCPFSTCHDDARQDKEVLMGSRFRDAALVVLVMDDYLITWACLAPGLRAAAVSTRAWCTADWLNRLCRDKARHGARLLHVGKQE
jgi:hypothetical protein